MPSRAFKKSLAARTISAAAPTTGRCTSTKIPSTLARCSGTASSPRSPQMSATSTTKAHFRISEGITYIENAGSRAYNAKRGMHHAEMVGNNTATRQCSATLMLPMVLGALVIVAVGGGGVSNQPGRSRTAARATAFVATVGNPSPRKPACSAFERHGGAAEPFQPAASAIGRHQGRRGVLSLKVKGTTTPLEAAFCRAMDGCWAGRGRSLAQALLLGARPALCQNVDTAVFVLHSTAPITAHDSSSIRLAGVLRRADGCAETDWVQVRDGHHDRVGAGACRHGDPFHGERR